MTESESRAYQRLEALQDQLEEQLGSRSRGIRDLTNVPVSRELLDDIRTCVGSDDHLAIITGLYVLKGLFIEKTIEDFPPDFKTFLVSRVEALLNHPVGPVVVNAIDWYVQLRDSYSNYRARMLGFLASEDLGRRKFALRHFLTYAKHGEIEPLLRFANDDYAGEVRPMGDWEYELRNRALELIEKQLGKGFPRILRNEPYEGTKVTWYDWEPFLRESKGPESKGTRSN